MKKEKQARFELIFDLIKELFNTKNHYVNFDGNKITMRNSRETIILTANYNKISLEPYGLLIWNEYVKELELTKSEEEYISFSLKLYLQNKLK